MAERNVDVIMQKVGEFLRIFDFNNDKVVAKYDCGTNIGFERYCAECLNFLNNMHGISMNQSVLEDIIRSDKTLQVSKERAQALRNSEVVYDVSGMMYKDKKSPDPSLVFDDQCQVSDVENGFNEYDQDLLETGSVADTIQEEIEYAKVRVLEELNVCVNDNKYVLVPDVFEEIVYMGVVILVYQPIANNEILDMLGRTYNKHNASVYGGRPQLFEINNIVNSDVLYVTNVTFIWFDKPHLPITEIDVYDDGDAITI